MAEQTVRNNVHLIPTPTEERALLEALQSAAAAEYKPTPGQSTLVVYYDEKLACEASSKAWHRIPPTRQLHLDSCINAALMRFRGFQPGYLWILPDAGRKKSPIPTTFQKHIRAPYNDPPPAQLVYRVVMDEDSIRRRKRRALAFVEQTENLYVFCNNTQVDIPDQRRKHYEGTNHGQSLAGVRLEPYAHVWQMPLQQKKDAYGAEGIRLVGGPAEKDDGPTFGVEEAAEGGGDAPPAEVQAAEHAKPETLVPFCWHGFPKLFFAELLHVNNVGAVIDFTPGDGNFAAAVLERGGGTIYTGVCHTEKHCMLLRDRLVELVLQGMGKEGHVLYNPLYVQHLKKLNSGKVVHIGGDANDDDDADAKPRPPALKKLKATPNAKQEPDESAARKSEKKKAKKEKAKSAKKVKKSARKDRRSRSGSRGGKAASSSATSSSPSMDTD